MKSREVLAGEVQGLGRVAKKKQRKTKKGCQGAPVDFMAGEEWKAEDGEVEVQEEDGVGLPSAARRRREEAMKSREVLTGEEEGLGRLAKKRQKKTKKGCEGAAVGFEVGQELKAEDGEAEAEVDVEEGEAGALTGSVSDVCQSLMERYARSTAPQHRHLCASAAAMRSYLRDEGIPLTPPAYFAIAIAAVCDASSGDRETLSALSAFLSVLLPYVPPGSVPPHKAREAVSSLVALLENSTPETMAAPTVRSLVGSLGLLAQSVDLEDWSAVKLPLRVLLRFSVDRRPKVRRCAQLSVVKVFRTLKSSIIIGKASKVVFSLFQSYIPLAVKLCSVRHDSKSKKALEKPENIEVLHVLNIIQHLVAHMSLKFIRKCLPDVCKLFNGKFSMLTRNIIGLLEVILQKLSVDVLEREAENVISVLTSYVSSNKKIPVDTICSASTLLKDTMNTLHHVQPGMWIKRFTLVFRSIAGLLISHPSIGKYCADILRELINMDFFSSNELCEDSTKSVEADIIISMCSSCVNMLSTSSSLPNEHILAVISDLFLRLGKHSSLFMKEIVLKLSMWVASLDEGRIELQHVQQCLGSAIVSMGPENFLSIVSISFDSEKQTYSNMWLIPILKKYIVGASLQYFLEHVLPLSKSAEDICSEVRRSSTRKKLMAHVDALWSLLPAFCHYPTDTADHFDSLAKALIEKLKKDQSSHELVSVAIKELVNENKSQLELNVDQATGFMKTNFGQKAGCGPYYYPQKLAQKNIEVLASNSMELFKLFTDTFFDSPPEKRASLKDVIGCLASILGSLNLQNFFSSLLTKIELTNKYDNGRKLENHVQPSNDKMEEKRCLMIELASAFVDGADEDFIIIMFDYIKPHLSVDGIYQCEAFQTLSRILEDNSWFVVAQFDQLMDLLLGLESSVEVRTLRSCLTCLHFMFVHLLKGNPEKTNKHALLVLNEIMRLLKDSREEVRKSAYDTLLDVSHSLKNSESSISQSHHQQLFEMIMGYFSGSPPQIMSVAVAAISLLIYKDADLYSLVPDLMPTVLVLLQSKANEVIKAVLGLVKVLVSCLPTSEIRNLLPDVMNGILPWSSVSRNHFRSKVRSILEIVIRKCSIDLVLLHVPDEYKGFIKMITESRQKARSGGTAPKTEPSPEDSSSRRKYSGASDSTHISKGRKRWQQDSIRGKSTENPGRSGQVQVISRPKRKFDSLSGKQSGPSEGYKKGSSRKQHKTYHKNKG